MKKHKHVLRLLLLAGLLLALVLACNLPTDPVGPTVTIISPPDGSTVIVGQQVLIQSSASDEQGISHVELIVDSVSIRTDPPAEDSPITFAIAQPWFPRTTGDVTVQVVAYNSQNQPSTPASIILHVVESAAQATPVAPTQTPVPDVTKESGCTLNASFLEDVTIPDNSELQPGVSFVKTWRIRNSGTCDWGAGFHLVFVEDSQLGAPALVDVPTTAAGMTVDISVPMVAPVDPGTYKSVWRVQSDGGQVFGHDVYVLIVVPAPGTGTPTPTGTPTTEPPGAPPAAPSDLAFTILADGSVSFTWVDHAGDEDGFHVLADGVIHATLGANTEAYAFQEGSHFCDKTVQIAVVAYKGDRWSEQSNAVQYTGPPCPSSVVTQASGVLLGLPKYLDLDTGTLGGDGAGMDLSWQSSGGYRLGGENGAKFGNLIVAPDLPTYAGCAGASRSAVAMYTPDLQVGLQLCFTTTEGNLTALRVDDIRADHTLVVSYVTWEGTP